MELGIAPAELGAMSPAEVRELLDAWQARERRLDFRAGQVCFLLAEINRDRESRPTPFSPADFFSSLEALRPEPPSVDQLEQKLEALSRGGGST